MSDVFGALQVALLGAFLAIVVWRTLSLWRAGVQPLRLDPRGDGEGNLDTLLVFLGVNVWVSIALLGALLPRFGWLTSPLVSAPGLRGVGALVQVAGLALFAQALRDLGAQWRLGTDSEHPGYLVTWGVYRVIRHPIYLFFDLFFLGAFLLQGTAFLAAIGLALGLLLHRLILREERFLLRVHGLAYRRYAQSTARYLPWRWLLRGSAVALRRALGG